MEDSSESKAPGPGQEEAAITRITRGEADWPQGLESIEVEPAELWLRGRLDLLGASHRVAIVGSRAPTPYGTAQAYRFGAELAAAGVCIISGLARGVDAAAHTGALDAGGDTIAVLGCGVDTPWPAGPLAGRMAAEGLLISEFAPGVGPRRHHFPLRNRIIAALADAVLVVEAAKASGSLITTRWALDQGQDVFALPGRVDHPMAQGTLGLLREGATPVGSPAMLLRDLYGEEPSGNGEAAQPPKRAAHQRAILDALLGETRTAAEVAAVIGRDVSGVLGDLVTLEMDGAVQRSPGGLYRLGKP